MGLPVYNKINWDEITTAISPTNLNHMDEGIKDNNDYLQEYHQRFFQLSGNPGGDVEVTEGGSPSLQSCYIVPGSGKKIVLRKARFRMSGHADLRLRVLRLNGEVWDSDALQGDVEPNFDFASGIGGDIPLVIRVTNAGTTTRTLGDEAGWWLLFEIVDE